MPCGIAGIRARAGAVRALAVVLLVWGADHAGPAACAGESAKPPAEATTPARVDPKVLAGLEQISEAFSIVAETVKPSVVNIQSLSENTALSKEWRRLFGDEDAQPPPSTGTGSGVIIDEAGHIVTNNHLVGEADVVRVTLADGRKFRAEVIGADPKTDLAVLKIDARGLRPARFGDSDSVRVGHLVLAIGSPFRLGHSVSHGIISALSRTDVDVDVDYQNWLQTDAPINPGNSGGPLINTRGEVIGINVAIATETGGHQGVGFAIPSNTVARIARILCRGERIVRGYLGVEIRPVDPALAEAYGLPDASGVFVGNVGDDTPAARAGLEPEDIILKIDGRPVTTRERLQEVVASIEPGTQIRLSVWRKGRACDLTAEIGEQPKSFSTTGSIRDLRRPPTADEQGAAADRPASGETDNAPRTAQFEKLGFDVATLTPALAAKYRIKGVASGVLITRVDVLSEAYQANLRRGCIIVRVNDSPVRSVTDLERLLTDEAVAKGLRLRLKTASGDFYTVLRVR